MPEPRPPLCQSLHPSSAMHGAKPKAQAVLGLGAWGKGAPCLGGLNRPSPFPQYKRFYPPYFPDMLGNA